MIRGREEIFLNLIAERQISRIAQAGHDVRMFVHIGVDGGTPKSLHLRGRVSPGRSTPCLLAMTQAICNLGRNAFGKESLPCKFHAFARGKHGVYQQQGFLRQVRSGDVFDVYIYRAALFCPYNNGKQKRRHCRHSRTRSESPYAKAVRHGRRWQSPRHRQGCWPDATPNGVCTCLTE